MSRDRRGRFTAERTTETIERVTERVILEDTLDGIPPVNWAEGWDPGPLHAPSFYRAQRQGQVHQARDLLVNVVLSFPPGEPIPRWVVPQAVNILRAGPNATPLELTMGRSI